MSHRRLKWDQSWLFIMKTKSKKNTSIVQSVLKSNYLIKAKYHKCHSLIFLDSKSSQSRNQNLEKQNQSLLVLLCWKRWIRLSSLKLRKILIRFLKTISKLFHWLKDIKRTRLPIRWPNLFATTEKKLKTSFLTQLMNKIYKTKPIQLTTTNSR